MINNRHTHHFRGTVPLVKNIGIAKYVLQAKDWTEGVSLRVVVAFLQVRLVVHCIIDVASA